jgi:hypothetical protein
MQLSHIPHAASLIVLAPAGAFNEQAVTDSR